MMAVTLYPFTVELVDGNGEPQIGLTLFIEKQDSADPQAALTELGNGWYEHAGVTQGLYLLYNEAVSTGKYLNHMPSIYEEGNGVRHVLDARVKSLFKTPTDYAAFGEEFTGVAIQSAIDNAVAEGVNKVVLPRGIYIVGTELSVPVNNFILEGNDAVIQRDQAESVLNLMRVTGSGVTIKGIVFDGGGTSVQTSIYFDADGNSGFVVTQCKFINDVYSFDFRGGNDIHISNCDFSRFNIDFQTSCERITIANCTIDDAPNIEDDVSDIVKGINNHGWNSSNFYVIKTEGYINSNGVISALTIDLPIAGTYRYNMSYATIASIDANTGVLRFKKGTTIFASMDEGGGGVGGFYPSQNRSSYYNIITVSTADRLLTVEAVSVTDFAFDDFQLVVEKIDNPELKAW